MDKILELVGKADTAFYLTGGTALGRFYLNHRYSDDLDFFVNKNTEFRADVQKVLSLNSNPCIWTSFTAKTILSSRNALDPQRKRFKTELKPLVLSSPFFSPPRSLCLKRSGRRNQSFSGLCT